MAVRRFLRWHLYVPSVENIVHQQCNSLVNGVPGNIETNQFMDKGIRFGIGANPDTEPAIGADVFPIGIAFFHIDGPMTESSTRRLVFSAYGLGRAIVGTLFTNLAEMGDRFIIRMWF